MAKFSIETQITNKHQILKQDQISDDTQITNEPQIFKDHQISKQTQIMNEPQRSPIFQRNPNYK